MRGSRQTLSKLFCQRGGDQHTHAGDQAVNSIITTTTNLLLCKELRNSLGGWLATLDFVTGFVVWRGSVTVFLILLARRVRTRTARIRPWPGIWIWAWTRPAKRKKNNNLLKWKSLHAATTVSCLSELNWWPDHLVASVSPALSLSSEGKTKRWHNEMKIQSFFLCNDPFSWMVFFFCFTPTGSESWMTRVWIRVISTASWVLQTHPLLFPLDESSSESSLLEESWKNRSHF